MSDGRQLQGHSLRYLIRTRHLKQKGTTGDVGPGLPGLWYPQYSSDWTYVALQFSSPLLCLYCGKILPQVLHSQLNAALIPLTPPSQVGQDPQSPLIRCNNISLVLFLCCFSVIILGYIWTSSDSIYILLHFAISREITRMQSCICRVWPCLAIVRWR